MSAPRHATTDEAIRAALGAGVSWCASAGMYALEGDGSAQMAPTRTPCCVWCLLGAPHSEAAHRVTVSA